TPIPNGWVGQYFNNQNLSGSPTLTRVDSQLDFDWGDGSPDPSIPIDRFSVRWTRVMNLTAGDYNFFTYADDGVRLFVDNNLVINEWHTGGGPQYLSSLPLGDGQHTIVMEYFDEIGRAAARLGIVNTSAYPQVGQWGTWKGEYFDNASLGGDPKLVRQDSNISFDWGGGSPDASIPVDNFSVRWTTSLYVDSGDYDFFAYVDDGVRLYVDGNLVIDQWQNGPPTIYPSYLTLVSGVHFIRVEYYDSTGGATAHLWWTNTTAFPNWRGEYFANTTLSGSPAIVRNDVSIDFDWSGTSPDGAIPQTGFSARWVGILVLDAGTYTFSAYADDGVRLWIDEFKGLDEWRDQSQRFDSVIPLAAGVHFVRMEYYQNQFGARALLTITKS
ncbi:MAG: PA14 domain-containing protein, partial [Dehalococcoidia bacterium]|nr:PA14 domain-containing protein [Dehalococcoidia bacterium]